MNSSEISVEAKCKELSRIIGIPLKVVGWYHSHNELGLQLTEEDIEFHVGFQAKFPNSIAFLALFGKNTADSKTKTTSFTAFRCGLNDQPVQLQCVVRPLLPNALAEKFYTVSSISFDEVLQIVREKLSSLKPGGLNLFSVNYPNYLYLR
ncbi:unnamed protein product [Hymenolepis diminuta]|uniref:MPN domain-containing protein n=1 Tax=Hymenolepis diminuta TaxID=6216 RepID=A0A0R3S984_HYMDI|nr:unnamed protein product [Hymenolepis diminuta]